MDVNMQEETVEKTAFTVNFSNISNRNLTRSPYGDYLIFNQ